MGGFGSGRRGSRPATARFNILDVRQLHRRGRLIPGNDFRWQWSCDGEVLSWIKIRTNAALSKCPTNTARERLTTGRMRITRFGWNGRLATMAGNALGSTVPAVGVGWPCSMVRQCSSAATATVECLTPVNVRTPPTAPPAAPKRSGTGLDGSRVS